MSVTKTVNDPFEIRKMIIQFANAETIEREIISLTWTLKNRGHRIAVYTEEEMVDIWRELKGMDYKTKQQAALMKIIHKRILEVKRRC